MTKPTPRALALTALIGAFSLAPLGATPIAGDSFRVTKGSYTTGDNNLVGQDPRTPGFAGPWLGAFFGSAAPNVEATDLPYTGVPSSGGSLLSDTNGRSGRLLNTAYDDTSTGTVYLSYLIKTPAVAAAYRGFELHSGGFDDGGNRVLQIVTGEGGIGALDSHYIVRIFNNGAFAADLGADDAAVNLFVVKIDFTTTIDADVVTIYRNPTDFVTEGSNTPAATLTGFNFRFDRTSIANFSGNTLALDEIRLGSAWVDVVGPQDTDSDGMPDVWEANNGLTIGIDDSAGDAVLYDEDGLTNLAEYNNNTDPFDADTDGDLVDDGPEVDGTGNPVGGTPTCPTLADSDFDGIIDGLEADNNPVLTVSDPNKVDTDGDGFADKVEVDAGSDPNASGSTPSGVLAADVIGIEAFDIVDGGVFGQASGEGWGWDNSKERSLFVGQTGTPSDWDGNAIVTGGKLQTQNSSNAFREFNGPGEGIGINSDEREGVFDGPLTLAGNTDLYFKIEMTRQCDTTYSGLSLFNGGGGEELFFGVLGGSGEFGLEETGEGNLASTGTTPVDLQTYCLVGYFDLDLLTASLWVDPALGGAPPAADAMVNLSLSNFAIEAFITRLRLESGGAGTTEWDNLVVATTWAGLSTAPKTSGGDVNLRDTFEAAYGVTSGAANDDGDSLTNQAEHDNNSNPTKTDTDGDGINDDEEVTTGTDLVITNPRLQDSDGDGTSDPIEIAGSANTFDGLPTDPNDCDSDDDNDDDTLELAIGTDPNDPGSNSGTVDVVLIDGVRDSNYGSAITVQTVQTGFPGEWDAAYAQIKDGKLYLMLTGNLSADFNKLDIFIDATDEVTTNVFTAAGNDFLASTNNMNGLTFDTALTPDYHLIARRGGGKLDFDFAALGASPQFAEFLDVFGGADAGSASTPLTSASNGTLTLQHAIEIGYDASPITGIGSGTGAADTATAEAVTTGLELCIDLCDLGAPDDEDIRIMVVQNNPDHNYLSNQILGGLPVGTGNLGGDGAGNFTGTSGAIDFADDVTNAYAVGDQFFSLFVPAGSATGCSTGAIVLDIQHDGTDATVTWDPGVGAIDLYDSTTLQSPWNGPISTADGDGTHTIAPAPVGKRFYLAVPTGSAAP